MRRQLTPKKESHDRALDSRGSAVFGVLRTHTILDTPVAQDDEAIVNWASRIRDGLIAMISRMAEDRQWRKAS